MADEQTTPTTVLVACGTLNVEIQLAELRHSTAAPGYMFHATEARGPKRIPIVVRSKGLEVVEPDEGGLFAIGKKRMSFDAIAKPAKAKPAE